MQVLRCMAGSSTSPMQNAWPHVGWGEYRGKGGGGGGSCERYGVLCIVQLNA